MEYKVKMPANMIADVTNFGYIQAEWLINELLKDENIKPEKEIQYLSISDLLVCGKKVKKAKYDFLANQVILELK